MPLFFSSEKLPPNKNKPSFIFSSASYGEDTYILPAENALHRFSLIRFFYFSIK